MHRHLCNAEIRLAISMWSDNIAYMHYCCIHWPMCDVLLKTSWRSSLSLSLSLSLCVCVCVCWAHPFLLPPSLLFSRSFSPFPVLTFLRVAGDNGMLMVCNVLELLTVSNWVFSSFQWKNDENSFTTTGNKNHLQFKRNGANAPTTPNYKMTSVLRTEFKCLIVIGFIVADIYIWLKLTGVKTVFLHTTLTNSAFHQMPPDISAVWSLSSLSAIDRSLVPQAMQRWCWLVHFRPLYKHVT